MAADTLPTTTAERQELAIRIHQLRTPALGRSALYLIGTALGTLVAYLIGYLFFMAGFTVMEKCLGFPSDSTGFVVSLFAAILGPVLWIWFMSRLPYKFTARFRLRQQRLAAVQRHPEGTSRLPHRIVEAECYRQYQLSAFGAAGFRRCPPGFVMLLNYPGPGDVIPPIPADRAFEPVDINDEKELWALFESHQGAAAPETDPPADPETKDAGPSWKQILLALWSLGAKIGSIAMSLLLPGLLLLSVWRSEGLARACYLGILLLLVAIPVLGGLLVERLWWLVPGGLVHRENRLWRKQAELRLFTPATTPLLLNWSNDQGYVVDGNRVRRFHCNELAAWLLVAAWRSPGRTPTLEELQVLLTGSKYPH